MNANTIVDAKPAGYRWANEIECALSTHPAYFNQMVQVSRYVEGLSEEFPDEVFTSMAIKIKKKAVSKDETTV